MVSKRNLRTTASGPRTGRVSGWGNNPLHGLWRLSPGRLAMYLTQLGDLLDAGVTMYEAMNQLALNAHDGRLRRMSQEMAAGAASGQAFGTQLERYSQLVPPHVRGMLVVGERSGSLPRVCREMADELRGQQAMRWKVAIGQLFFGTVLGLALLVPGMPRLINLDASADLPPWQRLDYAAYGEYLNQVVWPVLLIALLVWNLTKLIASVPALAEPVQRLLFLLPGARQLIRRGAMIRFTVSLEELLKAGVDIQEALHLAAGATGNVVLRRQLEIVAARVREGGSLQQALQGCKALPEEAARSLVVAEQAGTYERTLAALADHYRQGRTRATILVGFGAYGIMMLVSAAVVIWVAYMGYTGYFNAMLRIFDE